MAKEKKSKLAVNPEVSPSEFQALPLEDIIAAPLRGAIEAQRKAAESTKEFIESFMNETVQFKVAKTVEQQGATTANTMEVNAPLLSIVPVPHLGVEEVTTQFHYEISQTVTYAKESEMKGEGEAQSGWLVSKFAKVELSGSVSNKTTESSTANRSGSLDITVVAKQAPIPKGLEKILSMLANQITVTDSEEVG